MLHLVVRHKYQKSQGFTLLEMLTVVGIVGVLMAIGTPSLLATQASLKLSNSVEKLREKIEITQYQAIKKSKQCQVSIESSRSIAGSCNPTDSSTPDGWRSEATLENGISMTWETPTSLVYNFRGITQNSGTIILSSVDVATQKCVKIDSGLGLISTGTYNTTAATPTCEIAE
jgi:prepilin-type N-terminal cleavage/methylation domain-containing protein